MKNKPSRSLTKLGDRQKQLTECVWQPEARAKLKSCKFETRRKGLLGALLSQWMQDDAAMAKRVQAALRTCLVRQMDRDAFELKSTGTDAARAAK